MDSFNLPYLQHLICFTNIPYNYDETTIKEFARQFGQISDIQFLQNKGICFVLYYDIRDAKKAVNEISLKSNLIKANFVQYNNSNNRDDIFNINRLSSSILIVNRNSDLLNIEDIIIKFKDFGEINRVIISDNKKAAKIDYYDTRASYQACQSSFDNLHVSIVNSFENNDCIIKNLVLQNELASEKVENLKLTEENSNLMSKAIKSEEK